MYEISQTTSSNLMTSIKRPVGRDPTEDELNFVCVSIKSVVQWTRRGYKLLNTSIIKRILRLILIIEI